MVFLEEATLNNGVGCFQDIGCAQLERPGDDEGSDTRSIGE